MVGDAAAYFDRDKKLCPVWRRSPCSRPHTQRERFSIDCKAGPRRRSSIATRAAWRSSDAELPLPISAGSASPVTAWLSWLFLHIVQLIGFRNRILVLVQWAVAFVTFQRSVRLITHDDRSDRSGGS